MGRRGADRMRLALDPTGQGRQVWRDKRHSLSSEAAERTLVAAMAVVLGGRLIVVDVKAKFRCIAEQRLEFGGDRRVIGAGESGRGKSRRRGGGEKLNDERERDQKSRKRRRPERRRARICTPVPKRKFPAPEAHQSTLRCPIR